MEKITLEEVRHVAELARLRLSAEEELAMTQHLNMILEYMDKLHEVDTSQVPPTTHAIEQENVFRPDAVHPSLDRDRALSNAPQSDGANFVVPRVI
ncbi:Asp-tRNA(Asn)/Glu-tRNA(Gln) amidotransferase subunit GatC [Desulfosoma caldarium]|uniref:Asp-tRNA(Asn)/Glu-tRNA(Gln) amidotransferase subunit GatC n=1 Tax=Desulfosoma caldarium TaxID=610254 RepID=UPI001FEBAED6|nr:Asp-tRNA(Asn)/Glu-tRNA(Gln) amidotransferase subunit GatC [Desulfosoma caldarium]